MEPEQTIENWGPGPTPTGPAKVGPNFMDSNGISVRNQNLILPNINFNRPALQVSFSFSRKVASDWGLANVFLNANKPGTWLLNDGPASPNRPNPDHGSQVVKSVGATSGDTWNVSKNSTAFYFAPDQPGPVRIQVVLQSFANNWQYLYFGPDSRFKTDSGGNIIIEGVV